MSASTRRAPEPVLRRWRVPAPFSTMAGRAAFGAVIALIGAAIAARWGEAAVYWMAPVMRSMLQALMPEFRLPVFAVYDGFGPARLYAQAQLVRPLQIGHHLVDQPVLTTAQLTLGAFWQPVAVAIAAASALSCGPPSVALQGARPAFRPSAALACVLAAAIAGLLATGLSVVLAPSMMAGMMMGGIYWHEASDQIIPHIVRLPRFLEEGGWLMLGLALGALVGGIFRIAKPLDRPSVIFADDTETSHGAGNLPRSC